MYRRILSPLYDSSFFLFGARGTGKTTLISELLPSDDPDSDVFKLDFLNPRTERALQRDPARLKGLIDGRAVAPRWVVLDEVQRVPKILDVVHQLIEATQQRFVLTGSSARKLRRGASNLLAGRAFVFHLFPLVERELMQDFSLDDVLLWGSLPRVMQLKSAQEKELFLTAYAQTYLREEIVAEQLVRNIGPFREFLEVAAQCNGELINYAKIARDVGVEDTTIKTYFDILEDTYIGVRLPAYGRSVRKQQAQAPKFYLFDLGVKRALEEFHVATFPEGSSAYGRAFEHFIVLEIMRLNQYLRTRYKLSYLRTKDDVEVDVILERRGKQRLFIEIKSSASVHRVDFTSFRSLVNDSNAQGWVICREPEPLQFDNIRIMPWRLALKELFAQENETRQPL